ncbi:MAG: hypothetical protein KAR13_16890 [Desulfobulbaceae bacterium]|nr:hypothetical protein [Desulfobulbaceae bacterium]
MSLFSKLLAIVFVFMLITCVLYVVFGQVTVRKLRKNPKTKDALGLEYVSGWDIINVAQALAFPRSWSKKLEGSSLYFIHANASILIENINRFDRILGSTFYWLLIIAGLSGALLVLLNFVGFFSE